MKQYVFVIEKAPQRAEPGSEGGSGMTQYAFAEKGRRSRRSRGARGK